MKTSLLLAWAAAALAPAANGQSVLFAFHGDAPGDQLGGAVASAGDVNADGIPDCIAGARYESTGGANAGSARVYSGLDGSALYTFHGAAAQDFFGAAVGGAGDVNADGFDDLVVGAWGADDNGVDSGAVRVFSGMDGGVLYTVRGDDAGDHFGFSVSGAGDVNSDGFGDWVVGAPGDDDNGSSAGSLRVFSGADGAALYTFHGDALFDSMGWSVSGAGDVNADGKSDVIAGAYRAQGSAPASGIARVYSGVDGSVLWTFLGDSGGDEFGRSVSGAGDVDGDGFDDLIAGAPEDDDAGDYSGTARVLSGADGSTLYTFVGGQWDRLGNAVSGGGDIDGDGHADLIVGAAWADPNGGGSGTVGVYSGIDGYRLFTYDGSAAADQLGISVAALGDVDGDGFDDLLAGAWGDDTNGDYAGAAFVLQGHPCHVRSYCDATPTASGWTAVLTLTGSLSIARNDARLNAFGPASAYGIFIYGDAPARFPFGDGVLCISPFGGGLRRLGDVMLSDTVGTWRLDIEFDQLPPPGMQPFETWYFQHLFRDTGSTDRSRFNLTNGMKVTFCL